MPLTDLIRYFNLADNAGESTLYLEGERAAAWHRGLRLGSLFRPIVDLQRERIVGHQATLAARREDGTPVSSEAAYALCETGEAVVHFDRLCRTLHALNLLAQRRHVGGYLQLAVHPRHLQAVPNQHGLVYEAILKRCGLGPADIVLEIDARDGGNDNRLVAAIGSYRQRGYRLALNVSTAGAVPAGLLARKPDIVKLPLKAAGELADSVHRAGVAVELTGIDSGQAFARARAAGAELGQGDLFGAPQADCRATHGERGVAYNALFPIGART